MLLGSGESGGDHINQGRVRAQGSHLFLAECGAGVLLSPHPTPSLGGARVLPGLSLGEPGEGQEPGQSAPDVARMASLLPQQIAVYTSYCCRKPTLWPHVLEGPNSPFCPKPPWPNATAGTARIDAPAARARRPSESGQTSPLERLRSRPWAFSLPSAVPRLLL